MPLLLLLSVLLVLKLKNLCRASRSGSTVETLTNPENRRNNPRHRAKRPDIQPERNAPGRTTARGERRAGKGRGWARVKGHDDARHLSCALQARAAQLGRDRGAKVSSESRGSSDAAEAADVAAHLMRCDSDVMTASHS